MCGRVCVIVDFLLLSFKLRLGCLFSLHHVNQVGVQKTEPKSVCECYSVCISHVTAVTKPLVAERFTYCVRWVSGASSLVVFSV